MVRVIIKIVKFMTLPLPGAIGEQNIPPKKPKISKTISSSLLQQTWEKTKSIATIFRKALYKQIINFILDKSTLLQKLSIFPHIYKKN